MPPVTLAHIFESLKRQGRPLAALKITGPWEPGTNTITRHGFAGKVVEAHWSAAPTLADLAALNAALNFDAARKAKLAARLREMPEDAQHNVLFEVVAHHLSANPDLALALGVHLD